VPSAWAFIAGGGVFDHKSFGPPTELPSPLFLPPGSRKTKALQTGRAGAREWTDCGLCAFGRRVGLGGTASSNGRSLNVLADEPLQLQLRRAAATPESREQLRERVKVEHRLATMRRSKDARRATSACAITSSRRTSSTVRSAHPAELPSVASDWRGPSTVALPENIPENRRLRCSGPSAG